MRSKILNLSVWAVLAIPTTGVQAQLPPQLEADRLLQKAAAAMEKKRGDRQHYIDITYDLENARETGAPMPTNFSYHLGIAALRAGAIRTSLEALGDYLKEQGTKAKYYKEALSAYSTAETRAQALKSITRSFGNRLEWHSDYRGEFFGEIKDRVTGLIWQACSSRDNWTGWECSGPGTTKSWPESVAEADRLSNRTGKRWRLPTKGELEALATHLPEQLIAGNPGAWIWTNEKREYWVGRNDYYMKAYVVSEYGVKFNQQSSDSFDRDSEWYFRFVRSE
ncbi:Lcl domain-containing protein [Thauera linaloolentis]|uniref:Lcl C-terminal domain-containing protein n=1 Tax=Thauera linaloolentis (strain DSM 12138 / JCM 21573 / CCUG 41526 / CIP 105981 / IAM 15112 / NBRC 102519 / 47Lol) TaxID=1123367 RepID=N6ZBE3_THAL4|nr:DUF1566 domain-containing protein [Thauera linaloolentis]ENO89514.1 hypothetical protein C666_05660 [Thauera linaloolentis 47Lol = DSM 12138]MCM8565409.1 DUF1566 domain-containing protein [Thauera linaloolentis]